MSHILHFAVGECKCIRSMLQAKNEKFHSIMSKQAFFFLQQLFLVVWVLAVDRQLDVRMVNADAAYPFLIMFHYRYVRLTVWQTVWSINLFCLFSFSVIRHKPRVILNVAHSLISHLSPFLRQIDYALDWMHVEAGRAVYRYNWRKKRLPWNTCSFQAPYFKNVMSWNPSIQLRDHIW